MLVSLQKVMPTLENALFIKSRISNEEITQISYCIKLHRNDSDSWNARSNRGPFLEKETRENEVR